MEIDGGGGSESSGSNDSSPLPFYPSSYYPDNIYYPFPHSKKSDFENEFPLDAAAGKKISSLIKETRRLEIYARKTTTVELGGFVCGKKSGFSDGGDVGVLKNRNRGKGGECGDVVRNHQQVEGGLLIQLNNLDAFGERKSLSFSADQVRNILNNKKSLL